jgi:succinate dehydrogenase / fumarate reductase cytochrome b subunit
MILTGIVVLIFVGVHLKSFKYGPHYSTEVDGVVMRDLHRLVVQKFSRVEYVAGYVVAMVFLGFHLRHGFWSAFQSLGVHHPRFTPVIYGTGVVLAILLAAGFIVLPVWIFFCGGGS